MAQNSSIDSLKYLKPDAETGKYSLSKVLEIAEKKETIAQTLSVNFSPGGKLHELISKNDPYITLEMQNALVNLPANSEKLVYWVSLKSNKKYKQLKKFSLDETKSNTMFAFWRTEHDGREGQSIGLLTINIKDGKIKYSIEDVQYLPGEIFNWYLVLGQRVSFNKLGFSADYEDFDKLIKEVNGPRNSYKLNDQQKEVKRHWEEIRPRTLKTYDVFSSILEKFIISIFKENEF